MSKYNLKPELNDEGEIIEDPSKQSYDDAIKVRLMRKMYNINDDDVKRYKNENKSKNDKEKNLWQKGDYAIIKDNKGKAYNYGKVTDIIKDKNTGYECKVIKAETKKSNIKHVNHNGKKQEQPQNISLIYTGTNDGVVNVIGTVMGAAIGVVSGIIGGPYGMIAGGFIGAGFGTATALTPDGNTDATYTTTNWIPEQGKQAYDTLINTLNSNHGGKVYLSAHSLGGMNVTYALAQLAVEHPEMMNRVSADIFDAPNIYENLTQEQKDAISKYPNQIHVYVKHNDFIGTVFGLRNYELGKNHIGILYVVDSDNPDHNYDDLKNGDKIKILNIYGKKEKILTTEEVIKIENKNIDILSDQIRELESKIDVNGNAIINGKSINVNRQETLLVAQTLSKVIEDFDTNMTNKINKAEADIKKQVEEDYQKAKHMGTQLTIDEVVTVINENIIDYNDYINRLEEQKNKIK